MQDAIVQILLGISCKCRWTERHKDIDDLIIDYCRGRGRMDRKGRAGSVAYSFWSGILEVLHCVFHPWPCLALALALASWS